MVFAWALHVNCYFTSLFDAWNLSDLCPPWAFVLCSPQGLSIISETASSISVSCWQPDMGVQYHPWSKVRLRRRTAHLIQWVWSQGWGYLRAIPGFRVFLLIPPLLGVAYLQPTSFIGRILFDLSGVGAALFRSGLSVATDG